MLQWLSLASTSLEASLVAVVKMAASAGPASPPSLVVLAPIHLLPDSQLLIVKQAVPIAAPVTLPSHETVPPPPSAAVGAPSNRDAPPIANPGHASRQRCSNFSVDFLLKKMAGTVSPMEDLQAKILPLVQQQQQGGRGGGGLPAVRCVCAIVAVVWCGYCSN